MAKWLLVDGSNIAFRCFYAISSLTRQDGFPTNAMHGWINSMWKLEDTEKPDRVLIFFDISRSKKRLTLLPTYKANRTKTPDEFKEQLPWLKKIAETLGHSIVEKEDFEADDVLASFVRKLNDGNNEIFIISSDKDLAQCITSEHIKQHVPATPGNQKLGPTLLDPSNVKDKFGVNAEQIVDYLALIGDSADNIPGIPGVGPKTATKWMQEYGSIGGILENVDKIKPERFQKILEEQRLTLKRNVDLITLQDDLPIEIPIKTDPNYSELLEILQSMDMFSALRKAKVRYNIKDTEKDKAKQDTQTEFLF